MRLRLQASATRFYILTAFLGVCVFTGGSSRADADLLLVLRPLTTIFLAMVLIATPHSQLVSVRPLLTLLGLFALTMAIQLVPLPPTVWIALPGHARFAEADTVLNAAPGWRPVSLTPDLTLNSLLALLPVLIMLIGFAGVGKFRNKLIMFPIIIAAISVLLGIIQISSGSDSAAYLYHPTSDLLPVGLFANRNHQAVMLAIALPSLAIWAREPGSGRYRLGIAGGFGLLLLPVILATGSRAGMALAGLGTIAAGVLIFPTFKNFRIPKVFYIGVSVLFLIVIAVTVVTGRAVSLDRFAEMDGPSSQLRWTTLPIVLNIIKDYLPFGAGYGAFDQIFRVYEPDSLLRPTFFNRAHNDILEIILSGGIPGLAVIVLFAIWWGRQVLRIARSENKKSHELALAKLGAIVTVMLAGASVVDYPLRTPLAAITFALACCWLSRVGIGQDDQIQTADHSVAGPIAFRPRVR